MSRPFEPVLSADDRSRWAQLARMAEVTANSTLHLRRVDRAKLEISRMLDASPRCYVAWSGGKDSTALTHLVCVEIGAQIPVLSIKDDLDFPGEEDYVAGLAQGWRVELHVRRPSFSLAGWIADASQRGLIQAGDDVHQRCAALSKAAFYPLVDAFVAEIEATGVFLGLRKEESRGRLMNRASHGLTYTRQDGLTICQPLADWTWQDVYAYLLSHKIEPLHVYRCLGLAKHPGEVRKSWWLPGSSAAHGQAVWLRRYYPSLYRRLRELMPDASIWA